MRGRGWSPTSLYVEGAVGCTPVRGMVGQEGLGARGTKVAIQLENRKRIINADN